MYWDIARHPGDVTENGIAASDDVVDHWGETGLDCDFSVTDMVLPSDAKYLFCTAHITSNLPKQV